MQIGSYGNYNNSPHFAGKRESISHALQKLPPSARSKDVAIEASRSSGDTITKRDVRTHQGRRPSIDSLTGELETGKQTEAGTQWAIDTKPQGAPSSGKIFEKSKEMTQVQKAVMAQKGQYFSAPELMRHFLPGSHPASLAKYNLTQRKVGGNEIPLPHVGGSNRLDISIEDFLRNSNHVGQNP